MNKTRWRSKTAATLAVLGTVVVVAASSASADSPRIAVTVGGVERCAATWVSSTDKFSIADKSADNRYCYVRYAYAAGSNDYRINKGLDYNVPNGDSYPATNVSGHSTIYWKLCREVPDNPDNCSSERSDAT